MFTGFNKTGIHIAGKQHISAMGISSFSTNHGYDFYCHPSDPSYGTIFFPALGRRRGFTSGSDQAGDMADVFTSGFYFTAAPYQYLADTSTETGFMYARTLQFTSNNCYPVFNPTSGNAGFLRGHAFQIRPVRDE